MAIAVRIFLALCVHEVIVMSRRLITSDVIHKTSREQKAAAHSPSKTKDLDWGGCASFTKNTCNKKEGCHYHYIWLDTLRQSCRFTDEHKLQDDQIATFFLVELARLSEKSILFAETGCISGGRWNKCHRRMLQIIRLFNYVRKAMDKVTKFGNEHPAYESVTSAETKQTLKDISARLATGFEKNDQTGDMAMGSGLKRMMQIPDEIQAAIDEANDAGMPLTDVEVASLQQAKQTSAMLAMTGNPLTAEQEEILRANIEASGVSSQVETQGPDVIDALIADNEDMMSIMDEEGRAKFGQADKNNDSMVTEEDDHELEQPGVTITSLMQRSSMETDVMGENMTASLMQLSARTSDGPLKIMWNKGWQGMQWLINNGLGWIFRRIAWTVVFLVTFVWSFARAAVAWPIAFGSCLTVRFLHWFFVTVMWRGKDIGEGFKKIGHCSAEMWDLVGFESQNPLHSAGSQIFIQPVKTASWFSGVYHVYKSGKPDACIPITCGVGAHCVEGRCFCNSGLVLAKSDDTNCYPMVSASGCECKESWSKGSRMKYGCSKDYVCEVDRNRPSYEACKALQKVNNPNDGLTKLVKWAVGNKRKYDSCVPVDYWSETRPLGVNDTIDKWGKEKRKISNV